MNTKVKKIIEIAVILCLAWGGQWLWSAVGDPILVPGSTEQTTLGTISTGTWEATDIAVLHGGTGASTSGVAQTNLGLAIGTNVQAWDAVLDDLAALSPVATDQFIVGTGAGTYAHVNMIGSGLTLSGGNFYWSWLGIDDLSETPDDNQIMSWDAPAAGMEWSTLTGTANQVTITPSAGAITLSIPQDIATTSDVTFGTIGCGTATVPHGGVGLAKMAIDGADGSSAGPHMQFTTATDDYPLTQFLNYSHDSVHILFDSYYDGAWKSSDSGSNFAIAKTGDLLEIRYDSGVTEGTGITWNTGMSMDTSGNAWFIADVSAVTFTDRTPFFSGDALSEIKPIRGVDGKIDHSTLPKFVKAEVPIYDRIGTGAESIAIQTGTMPGRNLSASVSMNVRAIQQLLERVDYLETEIEKLKNIQ